MLPQDIPTLIESDAAMMNILRCTRALNLPDWWIGAGFVRNKVWDTLHGQANTPPGDIDVVYFDPDNVSEDQEKVYEKALEAALPTGKWSVKNQARMHVKNGDAPYTSTLDAVTHWPETATAIAVTLDVHDHIRFEAPLGADDLLNLIIRPSPTFQKRLEEFRARQAKKNWPAKWPKVSQKF